MDGVHETRCIDGVSTRLQDFPALFDRSPRVLQMFEDLVTQHEIEAILLEGQILEVNVRIVHVDQPAVARIE